MTQLSWPNSKYTSVWYSGAVYRDRPCRVRMGDGHIEVSYDEDDGPVRYSGTEIGTGHFRLKSTEAEGEATLHMFPGSRIMEGYYVERGESGLWRIELA